MLFRSKITRNEKEFSKKLKNIKPQIKQIYIEGNLQNLNEFGIAIIGSRNSSKEGENLTKEFTKKLVENGAIIISGMANRNRYYSTRKLLTKWRKNSSSIRKRTKQYLPRRKL